MRERWPVLALLSIFIVWYGTHVFTGCTSQGSLPEIQSRSLDRATRWADRHGLQGVTVSCSIVGGRHYPCACSVMHEVAIGRVSLAVNCCGDDCEVER